MNTRKQDTVKGNTPQDFEGDDYESDEEEGEMEDENVGQIINVAFDAQPPDDIDFHGIKRLLQQLFVRDLNEELSELTSLIIGQNFIGSVLKQDLGEDGDDSDEDDRENIYNLSTVINISEIQDLSCIEKIRTFLSDKCEENHKSEPDRMRKILDNPANQVGLVISERFINIPSQVALPSYESLKADIEKAVRKKKKFDFSHLVLICKTYRARGEGVMGAELFFTNPEEQFFNQMNEFSYTFSVAKQRDTVSEGSWDDDGGDMESLRTIMLFDASVLGHLIEKLRTEIPQAET